MTCVNLKAAPPGKWICPICQRDKKKKLSESSDRAERSTKRQKTAES